MNIWRFLLDQWRLALFFFVAITLTLAVFRLALGSMGVLVPVGDILYSFLLAVVCFLAYVGIEYVVRRPFYREAQIRLQPESPLHSADTFTGARTIEQRLFLRILHHYYQYYARELMAMEERRKFFEAFTLRFAHQMKTPVTVLQLLNQELESELVSDPVSQAAIRPRLDTIAEECAQLTQSLTTMIYTSRLHAFEFDALMENVEILGLVREVINTYKTEWIRKSIFPKVSCEETTVWVASDRKWLLFVVDQIVGNALQYGARTDSPSHVFEIRVHQKQQSTTVKFMDEGIGIPQADVRRVFDPFFTGANGRTHSRSTGMGLYLVREVVDRLGHSITLDSKEGVGTTVTLLIPESRYYAPAVNVTKL